MRTLLVTGPGGAGTSTVAAATALRARESGARVRLLSTARPAVAGLADVVDVEVVGAQPALDDVWAAHREQLAALLPVLSLPPASSVVALPGTVELALLAALARRSAAGDTDLIVLDVGPVPAATALLALPGALRWWLSVLAPPRLRVLAAVGAAVGGARSAGASRGVGAGLAAVTAAEALLDRVALTDSATSAVHLVLRPEPGADGELRTAAAALGVLGLPLASATLARVLPGAAGEWGARRATQQDDVRAALVGTGLPVREVAEAALAPRDVDALARLDAAVPTDVPAALPAPAARRDGTGWLLPVPVPFVDRGGVELTRAGDDLVLTVAGLRRSLPLDPLLRRCTVTGGALGDPGTAAATLQVRFAPDPDQWPADLLAAEGSRT